jgi:hypothetical protein
MSSSAPAWLPVDATTAPALLDRIGLSSPADAERKQTVLGRLANDLGKARAVIAELEERLHAHELLVFGQIEQAKQLAAIEEPAAHGSPSPVSRASRPFR